MTHFKGIKLSDRGVAFFEYLEAAGALACILASIASAYAALKMIGF
jgi:hypothetical protein